jgi:hypothetical protein
VPTEVARKRSVVDPEQEAADKEQEQIDAIVATLQLLLGGTDGMQKADLLHRAFPGLIVGSDLGALQKEFGTFLRAIQAAMDIADGSSGLGALAAKDLNAQLKRMINDLNGLADFFEIEIPDERKKRPPRPTYDWIKE